MNLQSIFVILSDFKLILTILGLYGLIVLNIMSVGLFIAFFGGLI